MKIDRELAKFSQCLDSVITVGVFDGVHRGHHHIINHLLNAASKTSRLAGVVTFREHPSSVLSPDFVPLYITNLDERIRLLKEMGVDFIIPITFDIELSEMSAENFVLSLKRHLLMRELVIGPGATLGCNREGSLEVLQSIGDSANFSVTTTTRLIDNHHPVNSTQIRTALLDGNVTYAAKMLGRNFSIAGKIIRGVGRGKLLGFPTANLDPQPNVIIPADGIYATLVFIDQSCFMAATSIGTRPTFNEGKHTIEAHVLDLETDIYDREIRLEFVQRLRDEIKYPNAEALQRQIYMDIEQTKKILQSG